MSHNVRIKSLNEDAQFHFLLFVGNFPSFMTGDRIVGGQAAASPIPWQVNIFIHPLSSNGVLLR